MFQTLHLPLLFVGEMFINLNMVCVRKGIKFYFISVTNGYYCRVLRYWLQILCSNVLIFCLYLKICRFIVAYKTLICTTPGIQYTGNNQR